MFHIGIDIGTSSICGVLHNPDTGECESLTKDNKAALTSSFQYEKAQDPDIIFRCVTEILDHFTSLHNEIGGIGLSGQMHGILYIDREGRAVSPLYTWQDDRGNCPYTGNQTYSEYLSDTCGHHVSTGYGLVTHFYNLKNNIVPSGAHKICTIMDYVAMRLTNRHTPVTEYSNAAALGFFDKEKLAFDTVALDKAGIDTGILPRTGPSTSSLGQYNGIPVFPAIGDNQAAFLGTVNDRNKAIHVTVGTSSQISVYTPSYVELEGIDTRPLPGGGYILVGAELCGGYAFTLLKNFFAETIRFICGKEISDEDIYTAITSVPSLQSDLPLTVSTLFDGTRQAHDKRGEITGISTSNFLPQELVRGFARGISEALHRYYASLPEEIKEEKTHIVASGNGMKKNHLIHEAFLEQFGLPVVFSSSAEEAALGACKVAEGII